MPSRSALFQRDLLVRCFVVPLALILGYIVFLRIWYQPRLIARGLTEPQAAGAIGDAIVLGTLAIGVLGPLVGYRMTWRDIRRSDWYYAWLLRLTDWRPGNKGSLPSAEGPSPASAPDYEFDRLLEMLAAKANRAVRKRDRRLENMRSLMNMVEEGVLVMRPSGEMRFINKALEQMYDLQPLPLKKRERKRKPRRLQFEIRDQEVGALVKEALETGEYVDTSFRQASHAGRMLYVQCYPLAEPGGDLLLVFRDVTRQQQMETMRRDFVANVGHELRTPLATIKGYLETLEQDGLEDRETAARFLGIIRRNASRLEALIADLLELSRLDAESKREQDLEPVDLAEAMDRPMEVIEPRAREKGIEIRNLIENGLPLVLAKQRPLEQVMINLLSNAVQYSESGTQIEIAAEVSDKTVTLRVSDEGIGIPAEHLDRIFERFYRVDRDRSRAAGGTGLGLSIVRHIVAQFDGRVEVESREGEGTTFRVQLRRAPMLG